MTWSGYPESFEAWWERHGKPYEAAVVANGDTPWSADPEKRAAIAKRLGLSESTPPMELRRALWERRVRKAA